MTGNYIPEKIPLAAKLGFTLWMLGWVPLIFWAYGPANYLWLCNAAQLLLLWAVWRGNRLIISSQAGVVVLIGAVWTADLLVALIAGGRSLTGITGYMFDADLPLAARLSSLFHVALPVFVLWLCMRIGYDRRGPYLQCLIALVLVYASWSLTEPGRNINYAFAPFGLEQVWLPHWLYLTLLAVVIQPVIIFVGHWLVCFLLDRLQRSEVQDERH